MLFIKRKIITIFSTKSIIDWKTIELHFDRSQMIEYKCKKKKIYIYIFINFLLFIIC